MNALPLIAQAADAATSSAAGTPIGLIIGIVLAVLAIVTAIVVATRKKELPPAAETKELSSAEAPNLDPLAGRKEVDAPVQITERMSLKEIKEAKKAVLSDEYLKSDASRHEKEVRKGKASAEPDDIFGDEPATPAPVDTPAPTPVPEPAELEQDTTPPSEKTTAPIAVDASTDEEAAASGDSEESDAESTAPAPEPKAAPPTKKPSFRRIGPSTASGVHEAATETADEETEPAAESTAEPAEDASAAVASTEGLADETGEGSADVADASAASAPSTEVTETAPTTEQLAATDEPAAEPSADTTADASGVALAAGLEKTRGGFVARIGRLFSGKKTLDEDLVEQLEEVLFTADIGVQTSQRLLEAIQTRFRDTDSPEADLVWKALRAETTAILAQNPGSLSASPAQKPFVLMMVGVNGAGKTTTIGKLAAQYTRRGKKVLMVAGDTFRAAAVDQLAEWAGRVGCEIYRGDEGADPSGVVFDGLKHAEEIGADIVLCDTAGRLQTKKPLMDELRKIVRVADKALPGAPHETVLVIDANTGQNAIQQASLFQEAVPLTGLVLSKLDGTAKGGVVIGISDEMKLPIYFIGIGEGVSDLRRFDAAEFVEALF